MFGDDQGTQDNGTVVPPMDPSVMADPSAGQPVVDHPATPAYSDDTGMNPVQQMHQDAIAGSPAPAVDMQNPIAASAPTSSHADDELLAIKQDALGALSPLVSSLDQSPEEKFKTTMMMIQASDDRSLVKAAYEAAQSITDEKVKAQALLDVINEINYFTSHQA
jgi:hypothetical protein